MRTFTSVNVCTFTLHKAEGFEGCVGKGKLPRRRTMARWNRSQTETHQGGTGRRRRKSTRLRVVGGVVGRRRHRLSGSTGRFSLAEARRSRGHSAGAGDDTAVETADTPLISDLFFARTKNFLEDLPRDDAAHFSWDVPSRRVPGPHGTVIEETRAQAHASQVSRDE